MDKDRPYRKSTIPENAQRVFEGKIFDVYQWEQKLYDGTTETFERAARPDTIAVFPVLENGDIFLIKDTQPTRDTVITAPTGRIEEGETPEGAAHRELMEETGLSIGELIPWYSHQITSKIDWFAYVFIGKGCRKTKEPTPEAGEKIEPYPVSFEELTELVVSGKMRGNGLLERYFFEASHDATKMAELKNKFFG